ncbi:hypothetical protein HZS_199, partial [Henneguya salminicola]
ITSLLLIGDCIERGVQIPNLSDSIEKIVHATSQLVEVLNTTIAQSEDEIFTKEVADSPSKMNENIINLTKSAKFFDKNSNSQEAVKLLIVGANGILDNVLYVLSSYDDSNIRKIEKHLKAVKNVLENIINWTYEEILELAKNLQPPIIGALSSLTARIPEIISEDISLKIKLLSSDMKEVTTSFILELNGIVENEGTLVQQLYVERASMFKYRLYRIVIELICLIWMNDLSNGDIELFSLSLPLICEFSCQWLNVAKKLPMVDLSGKYLSLYVLDQSEKFITQKDLKVKDLHKIISETIFKFNRIFDSNKNKTKASESEVSDLIKKLNNVKSVFLSSYGEWVKQCSMSVKSSDLMTIDISSCPVYNEWKNSVQMICEASDKLCILAPESSTNREIKEILAEISTSINTKDLEIEFAKKGFLYNQINNKINHLCSIMSQMTCDKNIDSVFSVLSSVKEFQTDVNAHYDSQGEDLKSLEASKNSLQNLQDNIEKLRNFTLNTLNSYPIPMDGAFNVEKSLEHMQFLKELLSQAHNQFIKDPKNPNTKSKIDELVLEIQEHNSRLNKELLSFLPFENVMMYSNEGCKIAALMTRESFATNNPILFAKAADKLEFYLKIAADKTKMEAETCNNSVKKNKLENKLLQLKQSEEEFLATRKHLMDNNFDSKLFPSVLCNVEKKGTLLSDIVSSFKESVSEPLFLETKKIETPTETVCSHIIPDKYMKASKVIENPQSNDRIAVAASDLYKRVQSKQTSGGSLSPMVLEISYMFADMSELFKDHQKHSEMIETAKNISKNTQDIISYAQRVLDQTTDKRLAQLLKSALVKLPTLSNQLKIMSTLRASRLKAMNNKVTKETEEANEMLIDCTENLIRGIKDLLKAVESAEIRIKPKISQR